MLDFGPTSAGNINYVTGLGHSIYMSNLVEDAARPEYATIDESGTQAFDTQSFLSDNLEFQGRSFDAVTLWDTLDYLPTALVQPVVTRLAEVIAPGGKLLAFFHSKLTGEEAIFSRYHLTASDAVEIQRQGAHPLISTWSNRQVETLFSGYASPKFFLAKDTLREVIVAR